MGLIINTINDKLLSKITKKKGEKKQTLDLQVSNISAEELETLKTDALNLAEKFRGINRWIEENPTTDPNLYEMTEANVDYGILTSKFAAVYNKIGYPMIIHNGEKMQADIHFLTEVSPELAAVSKELYRMDDLRGNSFAFKENTVISKYYREVGYRCVCGAYRIPTDKDVADIKRNVLCKVMGIYFDIIQKQRIHPDYRYYNTEEFEQLKKDYETYKEAVGTEVVQNLGYGMYYGPDFGQEIETVIAEIEKNYLNRYSNARNLAGAIQGVNNWIEQNLGTDANLEEMTRLTTTYGMLASQYIKEGHSLEDPELVKAKMALDHMFDLRKDSFPFTNGGNAIINNFVNEVYKKSIAGEYQNPEDSRVSQAKFDLLRQLMAVYFYIIQRQKTEPGYQHDNKAEVENLNTLYSFYVDQARVQLNGEILEEAQFESIMRVALTAIHENYKYGVTQDEYSSEKKI